MEKRRSSASHGKRSRAGITIGRERFAKISAIEGIALTADMKKRMAEFDRLGLSASERRRSIINAHRRG